MIYLFDDMDSFSDELLARSLKVIPRERAEKAAMFRQIEDRKLSVIGYLLLAYGLKKEYGIMEKLDFSYGENGKPFLRKYPKIFFNISHCRWAVACSIADEETGIDVEEIAEVDQDTMQFVCNDEELAQLINSKQQALDFCKLWTRKESLLKLSGQGMVDDLKNVLAGLSGLKFETEIAKHKQYVLSACRKIKKR